MHIQIYRYVYEHEHVHIHMNRYVYVPNRIRTVQKFDKKIRTDGFPTETASNLLFKLKVTK